MAKMTVLAILVTMFILGAIAGGSSPGFELDDAFVMLGTGILGYVGGRHLEWNP